MKSRRLITLAALFCLGLSSVPSLLAQERKVLLVTKDEESADLDLMLTEEVGVMQAMLQEAGFTVVVASPSGEPIAGEKTSLTPDMKIEDVEIEDYAGVIMPCLATAWEPSPVTQELVIAAVAAGKPVAAQLGSVVTLARAGVLEGKKYAFAEGMGDNVPEFESLERAGHGVVEDGNIITSGVCPYIAPSRGLEDGTPALTRALIAKMGGE